MRDLAYARHVSYCQGIEVYWWRFHPSILGLYWAPRDLPPIIGLNRAIEHDTPLLRTVMAEELGHHFTTSGMGLNRTFCHYRQRLDLSRTIIGTTQTTDIAATIDMSTTAPEPEAEPVSKINTTIEELESFAIVKALLRDTVTPARLFYRDTESYLGILLDDNKNKWICRVAIGKNQINLYIPDENKKPIRYSVESIDDIYNYQPQFIEAVGRYLKD
jgi:hypothetical protein